MAIQRTSKEVLHLKRQKMLNILSKLADRDTCQVHICQESGSISVHCAVTDHFVLQAAVAELSQFIKVHVFPAACTARTG